MTTYNITATGTDSTTNSVVVSTTANMVSGLPIQFSGTVFGGIVAGDTYYIRQILSGTQITLSGTAGGALVALTTATGVMSATFTSGGQLIINTTPPGEPLESAFTKVNVNFDQIFAAGPVGSNVQIADNTILTLNTNGNLILAPNGVGVVQSNVNIVPNTANIRNLGSAVRRWNTIYTQYLDVSANLNISGNVIYNGDLVVIGNLTVDGDIIEAGNIITDSKLLQLSNAAVTANAANGSGVVVGANANIATFLFDSDTNTWDTNIGLAVSGAITGTSLAVSDALVYGNVDAIGGNFTGNVAASYFIGNGSQLTGINASSNTIFNGTSNVNIATANANVTVGVNGLANVAVFGPGSLTVDGWIANPRVVANNIVIPPATNASMAGPLVIGNSITGFIPDDSAFYVIG
jgi:hypothetical protein